LAQCLLAARSRGPLIPGWVAMKDRTPTGQRFMAANAASVQQWRMSQPREFDFARTETGVVSREMALDVLAE
jgi:hypothetical protein